MNLSFKYFILKIRFSFLTLLNMPLPKIWRRMNACVYLSGCRSVNELHISLLTRIDSPCCQDTLSRVFHLENNVFFSNIIEFTFAKNVEKNPCTHVFIFQEAEQNKMYALEDKVDLK